MLHHPAREPTSGRSLALRITVSATVPARKPGELLDLVEQRLLRRRIQRCRQPQQQDQQRRQRQQRIERQGRRLRHQVGFDEVLYQRRRQAAAGALAGIACPCAQGGRRLDVPCVEPSLITAYIVFLALKLLEYISNIKLSPQVRYYPGMIYSLALIYLLQITILHHGRYFIFSAISFCVVLSFYQQNILHNKEK